MRKFNGKKGVKREKNSVGLPGHFILLPRGGRGDLLRPHDFTSFSSTLRIFSLHFFGLRERFKRLSYAECMRNKIETWSKDGELRSPCMFFVLFADRCLIFGYFSVDRYGFKTDGPNGERRSTRRRDQVGRRIMPIRKHAPENRFRPVNWKLEKGYFYIYIK